MQEPEKNIAGSIYDNLKDSPIMQAAQREFERQENVRAAVLKHFREMLEDEACQFRPEDYKSHEE